MREGGQRHLREESVQVWETQGPGFESPIYLPPVSSIDSNSAPVCISKRNIYRITKPRT